MNGTLALLILMALDVGFAYLLIKALATGWTWQLQSFNMFLRPQISRKTNPASFFISVVFYLFFVAVLTSILLANV